MSTKPESTPLPLSSIAARLSPVQKEEGTSTETDIDSIGSPHHSYRGGGDDSSDEDPDYEPEPVEPQAMAKPSAFADPKSDRVFVLPSLFRDFPATVWIDYPAFLGEGRSEGREAKKELTDKRLRPLLFKSDRNINCIANACKRAGFRRLIKGYSFNLYWGHHLNEKSMRNLGPHQVINHFPGSYGIGRKDYLWKNVSRMQRQHAAAYDFCAKSYLLPRDRELFERDYEEGEVYIVKPPASAEGRGIRLINKLDQLPKGNTNVLVQRYLGEPYLINNKKFDLRIYVGVTSFDPLRIYVFQEGLARFATSDYVEAHSNRTIKDRYMHLTNYSVNKKSQQFVRNTDATRDDEGSKWSLSALYKHLESQGVDVTALQARIDDVIVKTVISVEHSVVSKSNAMCYNRAKCFELFGFDVLLDRKLKPWLIEVNVACSLSSSSPLDKSIKSMLMTDLFHMVGIVPFDRKKEQEDSEEKRRSRLLHGNTSALKHRNIFELLETPIHELPVDDLELIMTAEDEFRRRGHWRRVLPCRDMGTRYLPLFEFPRYKNTVLAKWAECPDWSLLLPYMSSSALDSQHALSVLDPRACVKSPTSRGVNGGKRNQSVTVQGHDSKSIQMRRMQLTSSEGSRRPGTSGSRSLSSPAGARRRSPSPTTMKATMVSMARSSSPTPIYGYHGGGVSSGVPLPKVVHRLTTKRPSLTVPPSAADFLDAFLQNSSGEQSLDVSEVGGARTGTWRPVINVEHGMAH